MTKNRCQTILTLIFFLSILVVPVVSLFWSLSGNFFQINRIIFIFYPVACMVYALYFREVHKNLLVYILVLLFYAFVFYVNHGEFESLIRFFVPVFFLITIRYLKNDVIKIETFFVVYLVTLLVPLFISVLQLCHAFPFYDGGEAFWLVDEGRISGGYLKPNNLVAYFFPAYLYAFYLLDKKTETKKAIALITICLLVIFTTNLRTGILIYCLLLPAYFFSHHLDRIVHFYYRFCGPLIVGTLSFVCLGWTFYSFGPVVGLRDRLPMWQAHSADFFGHDLNRILFGVSRVRLAEHFHNFHEIAAYGEAHNNIFRIIITFGLTGFVAYCLWMRKLYLTFRKESPERLDRFLINACFVYFIVYSVTNEPSFYASIFLTIFVWAFLIRQNAGHPE